MRFLYTFFIHCYGASIRMAALFGNKKAILWRDGRKGQWQKLKSQNPDEQWIWVHVSSLGEFEQGLPIIEAVKKNFPQYKLLLTFFSPSGYEIKKDYPNAEMVAYLPLDTMKNANRFVENFNFKAAIFVKYEFWFNYIKALSDKHIPLFYISTKLRRDQYFFKPWGRWFRNHFYKVEHFFTQNKETADLLNKMGINDLTVAGDTRFDRVYDIAMQAQRFDDIEEYIGDRKCIIAGSSWPSDEKLLYNFIDNMPENYCFIMVPHDISDSHVKQIVSHLDNYQLYTDFKPNNKTKTLVINKIGILSKIYRYAKFAYIGAGFYNGIHNIQEAIIYDVPVIFGPKYHGFEEAVDLVELKGAFVINNQQELEKMFYKFIDDEEFYKTASEICHDYVAGKIGATEKTMSILKQFLS